MENIGIGVYIRYQVREDKSLVLKVRSWSKKKSTSTFTKFPVLFLYSSHRPQLQVIDAEDSTVCTNISVDLVAPRSLD